MENSTGENGNQGSGQNNGTNGNPNSSKNGQDKKPIRFFEIMTFFLGIVIATLCHGLYQILSGGGQRQTLDASFCIKVIYALSFLLFLVKCFIDDVMNDYDNDSKIDKVSRVSVTLFAVAWVFILFAALSVNQVSISSLLLIAGLFFLICFILCIDKEKRYCFYAKQNALLILILLIIALCECPLLLCLPCKFLCRLQDLYCIISPFLKEMIPAILFFIICFALFLCPLIKREKKCCICQSPNKTSSNSNEEKTSCSCVLRGEK